MNIETEIKDTNKKRSIKTTKMFNEPFICMIDVKYVQINLIKMINFIYNL